MATEADLELWWDRLSDLDLDLAKRSLDRYELDPEVSQMFSRTGCPVMLGMHGYPPQPDSWVVSLPDQLHEFITRKTF